jgi:hypothetical protein
MPPRANPADVCMDICAGVHLRGDACSGSEHGAASPLRRASLEQAATVHVSS